MTLGDKIKKLRLEANIKQSELAEQLGVARTAISNWEKDINKPNVDLISRMCYIFNVSPDYFFDIEKAPEPKEPVSEAEVERLAVQLYQALLRAGLVEEGQELTERQMRAIEGICDVLSVVFDDAN